MCFWIFLWLTENSDLKYDEFIAMGAGGTSCGGLVVLLAAVVVVIVGVVVDH